MKKSLRCALTKSANSVILLLMALCASVLSGCEVEEVLRTSQIDIPPTDTTDVIKDLYYKSERTLSATATAMDSLAKSNVDFKQKATFLNEKEQIFVEFTPTTYLYISLAKKRIEVASTEELPSTLTKSYIQSQTPFKNETTLGEDVVKVFEFDNGQIATAYYGYRYNGLIVLEDTLATPHLEIEDVSFNKDIIKQSGPKTEVEDPYQNTTVFKATYATKGVSGEELTNDVLLQPWYYKVVTSEPTRVLNVEYSGKFIGCPYNAYELTEKITTNKGESTNTYKVDLSVVVSGPDPREQPSMDSEFKSASTGKMKENVFSELKNAEGFTIRTMTGSYTSSNTGTKNRTAVESTVNFTYQIPVKFESEYGTYTIPAIKMNFHELGFSIVKQSETDAETVYKTTNTVYGQVNDCNFDALDEIVTLRVAKEKPENVVKVDSTYTIGGNNDDYNVKKEIIWSDGSKTSSTYQYSGKHEATAKDFGEVKTTSLNWNVSNLTKGSTSQQTEEKKFSSVTKFTAVYTTTTWNAPATNGKERGTFTFTEMSPVVTFIDGKTTKTFPARKYVLTGTGARLATNFSNIIRDGVSYKAYDYIYTTQAVWNQDASSNLVSNGKLLVLADEVGTPTYTPSQSWNGNTTTVKITKTTPHTAADDEVEIFSYEFTVSLSSLTNGKIYAENTSFSTTESHSTNSSSQTDGKWTLKTYTTDYAYVVSNNAVNRTLPLSVKDAEITFKDGDYTHTFNVRLNMSKTESFDAKRTEGDYDITPHKLRVVGTSIDGKSFSTTGTTDIYVKRQTEPEEPNLGRPKNMIVTATFDPTGRVTKRAFVFNWEDGVTYAVCDYDVVLPDQNDFSFKIDSYTEYNSVGYDKNNSDPWQPARGVDSSDAIRWYYPNNTLMSAIDKALTCKTIGWRNIVGGKYSMVIPGYTYTINGYYITVTAPNGDKVTFNSHHN